ncbi:S9 family peptidase [Brassicibacter mesophilus]|uniref:S9 family peptidase n=1 Tax=Brassicibacter mesophilus TaxID=745119 RepID=UPI003D1CD082
MTENNGKYLTIEEIVALPSLENVSLSDNGENVAYVKKSTDWENNKFVNHVWIYEKEGDKHYPLTTGQCESSHPLWSPDSKLLAYLSPVGEKEKKKTLIFLKSFDEHNGVQITTGGESVESFKWSPDGRGIYYLAKVPESKIIKRRKETYGDFRYVDREYRCNCLYYLEIEKGIDSTTKQYTTPKDLIDNEQKNDETVCQLTDGKNSHIQGFDISTDGKSIVFAATPTPDMKDYNNVDLYILDTESKNINKLNIDAIIDSNVVFSPDGLKICYTRSINEKEYYKNKIDDSKLAVYDIESGKSTFLLPQLDRNATPIRWTDRGILVNWQDKTNYLIGMISENGEFNILDNKDDCFIIKSYISKDGKHLAFIKASSTERFEVYLDGKKITNENEIHGGRLLSRKEVISWQSSDGLEIEGVLSMPYDYDSSRKYPLLVVIHGGPTWASFPIPTYGKLYPIEQLTEKGFLVLEPNYRGSSGYGNDFLKANYRKLGIGDYDDVISGVDMLIGEGLADKDNIGVMGWSQGGYISAFCTTYSDRFKAVSVGAGISNWVTYYVNTDIHPFTRMYLGDNPWNDPEIYAKTSPMTYIKSACTPTLIQHGEKDARVPTPNAYELYQGLNDMGVETELVIFKGMGHVPDKPGFNRAIMKQNLLWFCHYILGESIDELIKLDDK